MEGSVSGINFLPIIHMCSTVRTCAYRVYNLSISDKDCYTPGWLALYPSWLGLWSELAWSLSTLSAIFIFHYYHHHQQAAFENLYCPARVVIKFQAGGLLLLGFTTNCASGHWAQKLVPVALVLKSEHPSRGTCEIYPISSDGSDQIESLASSGYRICHLWFYLIHYKPG